METKVSYAVVGAFVLALAAVGIGGVLWLGSGRLSQKRYDTFLVYTSESVSGLSVRAPVKYKGVEVGSVREIELDVADPERVRLILAIQKGVPVSQDTVATLGVQGLTGIAYVELGGGSRGSPPVTTPPGEAHPVIRSAPSMLSRFDTAATTLLADLDRTTKQVSGFLDEETRTAFRHTLADLQRVTHALARRSGDLEAGLAAAARTAEHSAAASAELGHLVERLGRSAEAVERMAGEVGLAGQAARAAFDGASGAAAAVGGSARQLDAEVLPEIRRLAADLRGATRSLGALARGLERNPGALVAGRPTPTPGPGE